MKKQILVVSDPAKEQNGLSQWVNKTRAFTLHFVGTDEKAIEVCNRQNIDMVVIDRTNTDIGYKKLMAVLPILQTDALIIGYEGETAKELQSKLIHSLNQKKAETWKRYLILDSSSATNTDQLPPFSAN